jgi:phosphodiesterase/alkaline phosphatase D-like protein
VKATNAGGSAYSVVQSASTLSGSPTLKPATFIKINGFIGNWNAIGGSTSYTVEISQQSNFSTILHTATVGGSSVSYQFTGLQSATRYYWRVKRSTSTGDSPFSASQSVLTLLPAPRIKAATNRTDASFTANWAKVDSAASYFMQIATDSLYANIIASRSTADTSIQITGLQSASRYFYRVRSVNYNSAFANSTIYTIPSTPAGFAASGATKNTIRLVWNAVPRAESYRLEFSPNASFSSNVGNRFGITDTTYLWTGLAPNTTYYFRVRSYDAASNAYSVVSGIILPSTLPNTGARIAQGETMEVPMALVYPNPSAGIFNLVLPQGSTNISVYSLQGVLVAQHAVQDTPAYALDLAHMPKGLYMLKIEGAGNAQQIKLYKE